MNEEIKKLIDEEAERYADSKGIYNQHGEALLKMGFKKGANFILSKRPEILFDFFIWFRENGEKYIDMSVEKMIEIYIKDRNDGK